MKTKTFTLLFMLVHFSAFLFAQTWQKRDAHIPPGYYVVEALVPDASNVWTFAIELDTFTPSFANYLVSRSTDGGETWESVEFPHEEPGYLSYLFAVGGDEAWICYVDFYNGNKLLKTEDGGVTWEEIPIDITVFINHVHFFDALNGLAMGDPDSLGFQIFTTDDGGDTWSRVDPANVPPSLPDEVGYGGFYEVVGQQIWSESSAGRIYYSPDMGHTWEILSAPKEESYLLMGVDNAGVIYVSYTTSDADGSNPVSTLHRSLDNGQNWEDITPEDDAWWIHDVEPIPGNDVIVAGFNRGFIVGIVETRLSYHHGLTWITIDNENNVTYFDFLDEDTGFSGSWAPGNDTLEGFVHQYIGSPITGLFNPQPLMAKVTLLPNPVIDLAQIRLSAEIPADYIILLNDASGQLLSRQEFSDVTQIQSSIDMQEFASGMYTVTITTQEGVFVEQIIKQ